VKVCGHTKYFKMLLMVFAFSLQNTTANADGFLVKNLAEISILNWIFGKEYSFSVKNNRALIVCKACRGNTLIKVLLEADKNRTELELRNKSKIELLDELQNAELICRKNRPECKVAIINEGKSIGILFEDYQLSNLFMHKIELFSDGEKFTIQSVSDQPKEAKDNFEIARKYLLPLIVGQ
jgi:hypothetical protein